MGSHVFSIITFSCCFKITLFTAKHFANAMTFNEFITCFSRILYQRIYESFKQNLMFHFLEGWKVSFSVLINSYIGIFYLKRKLLSCRITKQRNFREKNSQIRTAIVKTCDELDLFSMISMNSFWSILTNFSNIVWILSPIP